MKRIVCILFLLCALTGCSGNQESLQGILQLREKMLVKECAFDAVVTADYGDQTYTFAMGCIADAHGNLSFEVREPETIAGIRGNIAAGKGSITFEDTALAFELLADGYLSPVSAPWVLVSAIRSGYVLSGGKDGELTRYTLRDTYEEDAVTVDIWMGPGESPMQAEILWKDRKILTVEVKNFVLS